MSSNRIDEQDRKVITELVEAFREKSRDLRWLDIETPLAFLAGSRYEHLAARLQMAEKVASYAISLALQYCWDKGIGRQVLRCRCPAAPSHLGMSPS